jgi:hypothetical protein
VLTPIDLVLPLLFGVLPKKERQTGGQDKTEEGFACREE